MFYFGTVRHEPDDVYFYTQWSLDTLDAQGDRIDIDAPEAWAIERGTDSVIIGIVDQGHTLDTFVTHSEDWILHPDFYYYFNPAEDIGADGAANWSDVDNTDNSVSTDGDTLRDNIFGYNFEPKPARISERDYQIWKATPHNGTPDLSD